MSGPFFLLCPAIKRQELPRVSDLHMAPRLVVAAESCQAQVTSGSFSAIWTGWHSPSAATSKPLRSHPADRAHAVFC